MPHASLSATPHPVPPTPHQSPRNVAENMALVSAQEQEEQEDGAVRKWIAFHVERQSGKWQTGEVSGQNCGPTGCFGLLRRPLTQHAPRRKTKPRGWPLSFAFHTPISPAQPLGLLPKKKKIPCFSGLKNAAYCRFSKPACSTVLCRIFGFFPNNNYFRFVFFQA